jgi:flagellar basal-body rod modification protein FlgD
MTTEVKNQGNPLTASFVNPKGKSGDNSRVIGAGFNELYKSMDAPRKTPEQLSGTSGDMGKAIKNIDEAMDFATKLMLASARNMGIPGEEDESGKSQEMMQMAQGIATMMATKANVQAQMESIEQAKNPAVDLMALKGKQVKYDDSDRSFYGNPVSYNYKISHTEENPSASVNLTITIRNSSGVAVKTVKQASKIGEFSYQWNGKNESGNLMPPGTYTIDVRADGRKIVGGQLVPFPVTASATLSGEVTGVKIENGSAIGVVINGKVVSRANITDVQDMPEKELAVSLTPDLIGRKVELDFSKAKIQPNGSMEVYFMNNIEKPGDLTVQVFDKNGKYLASVTNKEEIGAGVGKISFPNMNLEPAIYDIKVFVQDKENPSKIKNVELPYHNTIIVAGVSNVHGTLMSVEEETFDPIHITSVIGNYQTPIEQRSAELAGSQIAYRDDLFKFSGDAEKISFTFKKPEDDAVVSHGLMNIYDEEIGELVASVKAEYDLYSMLDSTSQNAITPYLSNNYNTNNYELITGAEKVEVNRYIEEEITAGNLKISAKNKELYDNGHVSLTFPAWDGKRDDGTLIDPSAQLRRDFTAIYIRDDNSTYASLTDKSVIVATVDYVVKEEGELKLHLVGGSVITEDLFLRKL